ncbi:S66 peptidase family protein [Aspergillus saccharolyticus JOP 1030-1]|uniref:Peptidase S66, LD-carboxypeptidase A n=1 Tax=Aspergillus saccharolyticus JOP 1030-1 TaxID=1450539 RepID=A0A318Z727_9EURO|nr:peptidase S66, LD-carboxypeptidase A [Aspergillus saccharolyticus JOP 1030-1]PYH42899.1 peptidase S66, LD-carboxypeptidase A [Aspergillus saccharolyticus JOP 1030-1]
MTPRPPILPPPLRPGDLIALISPSSRLNDDLPTPLQRGQSFLESLGFRVCTIYTPFPKPITMAESIRIRTEELHAAFADNSIRAILCTLGGQHANELLPFLDYELIRAHPKIFLGYSDTTFLHYALESRAGLRTFYGPSLLTDFCDVGGPLAFTVEHFLRVLTGSGGVVGALPRSERCSVDHNDFQYLRDHSMLERATGPSPPWRWVKPGRAEGKLYGGTVHLVERLQGTGFAPTSWTGHILLLESAMGGDRIGTPYPLSRFRGNLVDLALSGVLGEISGLVVGRGFKYDARMQDELAGVIVEVLETVVGRKDELPVLMNVDVGHTSPFLTLPFGARVRLDSEADEFAVLEAGVAEGPLE